MKSNYSPDCSRAGVGEELEFRSLVANENAGKRTNGELKEMNKIINI